MLFAGYVTDDVTLRPRSAASLTSSFVVSLPHSVFSFISAKFFGAIFFFASRSFRNSKKLRTNRSSCGVVRKNHLKPRVVSDADDDSALRNGIPLRSATWLAVAVTLLL